ncbi:MAG: UvrD-helicase domain-containing protein, partial [Planctomycetes bacterium]|nr:UvrD-helicase domain-containing protein [Planctomycetota bacterium]
MTRPPSDQAIRDRVVSDFDTTLLLEAGAGTGKTTVLVRRIVALLRKGRASIDRVAAITFTEKAAGELKVRLREELEGAAAEASDPEEQKRLRAASLGLDRAMVTTIHSFALAVLRERPFEAGLDPGFRVAADVKGERSLDQAWDDWIDVRLTAGDPAFVEALHLGVSLTDLREAGRLMIAERDILGRVVGGAQAVDPESFRQSVRRAAGRLGPLKVECQDETDGALASIEALEGFADRCQRAEGASLRSQLLSLKINPQKGNQKAWRSKETRKQVKDDLTRLRDEKEAFVQAVEEGAAVALRNRLTEFLAFFQDRQREDALVDFQGLLLEARNVLAREKPVRRYFQERLDALLIDEFQDTDPLQVELAALLACRPGMPPARWTEAEVEPGRLFFVGDPK